MASHWEWRRRTSPLSFRASRYFPGFSFLSGGRSLGMGEPGGGAPPNFSFFFQSFALFPWLTVLKIVEVPLKARGGAAFPRRKRALKIIDTVGLDGFEAAYPKE